MLCPICFSPRIKEIGSPRRAFFRCANCGFSWADPGSRLSDEECRGRYALHRNGRDNTGYVRYLNGIIDRSLAWASSENPPRRIMDWGSGSNPLCAQLLAERGFEALFWDPLFADGPLPEPASVDMVLCVEAAEHFADPHRDFAPCAALARPGAWVVVHTHTAPAEDSAFLAWWYIQDSTHVSFYSEEALRILGERASLGLVALENGRLAVFRKNLDPTSAMEADRP